MQWGEENLNLLGASKPEQKKLKIKDPPNSDLCILKVEAEAGTEQADEANWVV